MRDLRKLGRGIAGATAIAGLMAGSVHGAGAAAQDFGGNRGNGEWSQVLKCESWNYKRQECRVDARGGVQLRRVVAGDCRASNWGYRNDLIWVERGCRAEFAVRDANWNGGGQSGSTILCESWGFKYQECAADTRGGVRISRVVAGDCSAGNWGYRNNRIWVDKGCRAEFAVGSGGGEWSGGQTSTVRCESWGYKYQECRADTRGGVRIDRVIAGDCQSRNWGYRGDVIWVDKGCRADFAVRGDGRDDNGREDNGGGPSAGLIIGGIAVAAGLAALLASGGKKNDSGQQSNAKSARIDVNTNLVPTAARPSFQKCLDEAARQVGATGGTEIALDEMREVTPGNGGYRFDFRLKGSWPGETRMMNSFCRATNSEVLELDFN